MSSQTDKKEEFRKYLEKSNVLAMLTNILTDLFEMDNKPEDPCQYLYHRFGEALKKKAGTLGKDTPSQTDPNATSKDVAMADAQPSPALSADQSTVPPPVPPTAAQTAAAHPVSSTPVTHATPMTANHVLAAPTAGVPAPSAVPAPATAHATTAPMSVPPPAGANHAVVQSVPTPSAAPQLPTADAQTTAGVQGAVSGVTTQQAQQPEASVNTQASVTPSQTQPAAASGVAAGGVPAVGQMPQNAASSPATPVQANPSPVQ